MSPERRNESAKKSEPTRKFLVFSPHPDDVDFGCAATVARLTSERNEVVYCIITNGARGTHKVKHSGETMAEVREREQIAAAAAVGVARVRFLRCADGDLEHTVEMRKCITRVIREEKPNIVLSLDPGNQRFDSFYRFHRDHRVASEIVFDAMYPAVGSDAFFPELTEEEALPHQIDEAWFFGTDRPNLFFDVSKTLAKKIEALAAHESQIKDMREVEKRVRERAREAGKGGGMRLAEAFRRLTF